MARATRPSAKYEITAPRDLWAQIDDAASERGLSRAAWMREAAQEKLAEGVALGPDKEGKLTMKLSARVILKDGDEETHVDFFIRSVRKDSKLFDPAAAVDGWAAYRETPVLEQRQHLVVERVSVSPRKTIEEAALDMHLAIRLLLEKAGARLAWGKITTGDEEEMGS